MHIKIPGKYQFEIVWREASATNAVNILGRPELTSELDLCSKMFQFSILQFSNPNVYLATTLKWHF